MFSLQVPRIPKLQTKNRLEMEQPYPIL
jgi:hypothetical protein